MAKSNAQVAHLFAHKQSGNSGNLHSDGQELRSYSTVIAFWDQDICFVSSNTMTPTTGKQLSGLWSALRGFNTFASPAFGQYRSTPDTRECITAAAEEMEETFKTLCRSRANMESRIEHYTKRRREIIEIAARFAVDIPEIPEATGDLKERAKEYAKKDQERRQERERREREQADAQRLIDAGARDLWLQYGRGRFPYSYRTPGADQITVKNGRIGLEINPDAATVITSQGAEAPLDHVRKAIKFYLSRYAGPTLDGGAQRFAPYHTNGHRVALGAFVLDEIDEQGNVKAGCHRFTAQEIARFINRWKEVLG